MSTTLATRLKKAGLSGLFVVLALAAAAAESLTIEVVSAEMGYDRRTNEPVISFRMSEASKQLFGELTQKNVGRKMAVKVDGRVLTAPVIREPILGGSGQISSNFTPAQARELAARIAAGKATVEFEIVPD